MRHWLTPNSHHWPFLSLNRQLELERMRQLALTRVFQRQESKGIKRAGETCSQYSYYLDAKDSGACQAKLIPLTHLRQPKSRIGAPKGPWLTPDPKPTLVGRLSFARGSVLWRWEPSFPSSPWLLPAVSIDFFPINPSSFGTNNGRNQAIPAHHPDFWRSTENRGLGSTCRL